MGHRPACSHACTPTYLPLVSSAHRSKTRKPGGQEPELALRALLALREYALCDPYCRVMPRSRSSLRFEHALDKNRPERH